MHIQDTERGPAGVRAAPRLWPAIALLGLVLGAARLIVALTTGGSSTPAGPASATGAVPDYGPERALGASFNHAAGRPGMDSRGHDARGGG